MTLRWWQQEVIYQLLTPSFMDTDGDGEGDLKGVMERLDYLVWLGVGAVWLSPIYPSPMIDLGYDVCDFEGVDPRFGSLTDFDKLLEAAHFRGIKLILDWVPNHTSDTHPWFLESRTSRESPRRNWYIWRNAKEDGSEPTNWLSVFGGSAWQWDEASGQFFYHSFLESQPDLNWRNPEVRAAVFDAMRFWLRRGVDGFRIDAASWLIKDEQFRDNPPNPDYRPHIDGPDQAVLPLYTWDQPEVHHVLAEMHRVLEEFDDVMLLGELVLPIESIVTYYGDQQPELDLPLNMHLAWVEWRAEELGRLIETYSRAVPSKDWPTWTASTHDFTRLASRLLGDQSRIAAMLLLTLGGTPTLYYGEELGMQGVPIPAAEARDPQGRRIGRNRDPARTPMQWEASSRAGFTQGEPWLPIGADVGTANVADQRTNPYSLLTLYKHLIRLRREHRALVDGTVDVVSRSGTLLSFRRSGEEGATYLIIANLAGEAKSYDVGEGVGASVLLSTLLDRWDEEVDKSVELRGNEGVVLALLAEK